MPKLNYKTLRQEVVDEIRQKILGGEFKPGDRMKENEIAELFGVSRGPVREALRQIEQEGLVRYERNVGCSVAAVTEQDIYDRFADCAALMAEKTWGSCTDKKNARKIDSAAAAISGNLTDTEKNSRFKAADDIALTGGCSFVETGCHHLNTGSSVHMTIKFDEVLPGQILMEADAPYGSYDIRITENGKLGYTAEGYTYEFNYTPVPNKILNISIETKPLRTVLKTGMFGKKKAEGSFSFNGCLRCKNIKNSSLNIPVQRIGSATNSVKAHIYKISVKQQI